MIPEKVEPSAVRRAEVLRHSKPSCALGERATDRCPRTFEQIQSLIERSPRRPPLHHEPIRVRLTPPAIGIRRHPQTLKRDNHSIRTRPRLTVALINLPAVHYLKLKLIKDCKFQWIGRSPQKSTLRRHFHSYKEGPALSPSRPLATFGCGATAPSKPEDLDLQPSHPAYAEPERRTYLGDFQSGITVQVLRTLTEDKLWKVAYDDPNKQPSKPI